jgi:hypothetical protein
MSRKRHTTTRPHAQPAAQPQDSTQGNQRANLVRFTTKAWAISGSVLVREAGPMSIFDLVGFLHWLGDQNVKAILSRLPPLPCTAGCSYCCHVEAQLPDLLPPEALQIAAYLRDGETATLEVVQSRLAQDRRGMQDRTGHTKTKARIPCLLLQEDRCLAYPVRPMRCRAQYSPDVQACRDSTLGRRPTMPLLSEPALLFRSLQVGLRLGLRERGLQGAHLALRRALDITLTRPDTAESWLQGVPAFEEAVLPDDPDEERYLAQFARGAAQQVAIERTALAKVVRMFRESPGTWAAYSTRSTEPIGSFTANC